MSSFYVVIENGEPYENVYTSFNSAVTAVKEKYPEEEVAEQIRVSGGYQLIHRFRVPEDTLTGKTYL